MVITKKREVGDRGEQIVADYLIKQGYSIVERNYWRKWGEIDIVAKNLKDNLHHFVEVKSVTRDLWRLSDSDYEYSPADNITREKLARLSRVVQTYVVENGLGECDWQVDVVLVYLDTHSDDFKIEILDDIDL